MTVVLAGYAAIAKLRPIWLCIIAGTKIRVHIIWTSSVTVIVRWPDPSTTVGTVNILIESVTDIGILVKGSVGRITVASVRCKFTGTGARISDVRSVLVTGCSVGMIVAVVGVAVIVGWFHAAIAWSGRTDVGRVIVAGPFVGNIGRAGTLKLVGLCADE